MAGFHLRKWYLDCVDADGAGWIGYWARLRWGKLHATYAATLELPAGGEPRQLHAVRPTPPPRREGSLCSWRCDGLGVQGEWLGRAPGCEHELLHTPRGGIRWACHQPRSLVRLHVDAGGQRRTVEGLGYVEELDLTIPPWRLPFRTLWWGRFVAADASLVWLQWRGRSRTRLALLDGRFEPRPRVSGERVRLPSGDELRLHDARSLREGRLAERVLGAVPGLVSLLPPRFRGAHERKRLSRGELVRAGGPASHGWAIHEVVQW